MKLLLALQFWEGDRQHAAKLAGLIADLEPAPRNDVVVAMVARHDSRVDSETLERIRTKFPAEGYIIPSGLTGYPGGCNSLWRETVLYAAARGFDYVLTFEADCTPLVPDWIDRLKSAVEEAVSKTPTAVVFGAMQGPWWEKRVFGNHINGNCVVRLTPTLIAAVRQYVPESNVRRPWDLVLFDTFQRCGGTVDLREIRSDWRSNYHSLEQARKWITSGVVFHHGTRDMSLARQVRRLHGAGIPEQQPDGGYLDSVAPLADQVAQRGGRMLRVDATPTGAFNWAQDGDCRAFRVPTQDPTFPHQHHVQVEWGNQTWVLAHVDESIEDPRVIVSPKGDEASVYVTVYTERKTKGCEMRVYTLRRTSSEVAGLRLPGKHPTEKNWLPIRATEWTAVTQQMLYSIAPKAWTWRRGDAKSYSFVDVSPAPAARDALEEWQRRWGQLRGSTPLVRLPDVKREQWLCLTHSHEYDSVWGRRHYVGAAVLSSRQNGYRTLRVSKKPIFIGSAADGFGGKIEDVDWPAALFFPGSAELTAEGTLRIAGGLNDHKPVACDIPLEGILREMSS